MGRKPLTTGEIAEYCHVTHRAVLKWIVAGKLTAYRTPGKHSRIQVKDFLDFLLRYNMPVPSELQSNRVASGGGRKKILIVDDDKGIINAMKRILMADNQFDIETADDGFDAGRKFSDFKPDLIILDIKIPGLDGYQVCSYIRKDLANKDVKILAISGILDEEGVKRIVKLGADDYLPKPFDNETLKTKIEKLLNLKKDE